MRGAIDPPMPRSVSSEAEGLISIRPEAPPRGHAHVTAATSALVLVVGAIASPVGEISDTGFSGWPGNQCAAGPGGLEVGQRGALSVAWVNYMAGFSQNLAEGTALDRA